MKESMTMKYLIGAVLIVFSLNGTAAVAAEQTVKLSVGNMTCISCVYSAKSALRSVDGVKSADVLGHKKLAIVTFEDTKSSVKQLLAALTKAGFPSKLIKQAKATPGS
jgi:periplasmic mercuric ion binding protein